MKNWATFPRFINKINVEKCVGERERGEVERREKEGVGEGKGG